MTNVGLVDCSKQQTKLSMFVATSQKHNSMCIQTMEDDSTVDSYSFSREEIISFGSRAPLTSTDWSNQDLSNQVPIKQRLIPIWKLIEGQSLDHIKTNMSRSFLLKEFQRLYNNICNIMGYSCQGRDVCGTPGQNYACGLGQNCIRLWFPEKGHKNYFCENARGVVHWQRNSVRKS